MRDLLVTITLLSVVSSEESEPKKRLELPPEVDPNFWPVRGRRSYWDVEPPAPPPFSSNFIDEENEPRDGITGRETNYAGYTSSSKTSQFRPGSQKVLFDHEGELRAFFDPRRRDTCPRKRSMSLVLPLLNYRSDDIGTNYFCGGRCAGQIRNGRRRDDERSRTQQPLYVDEPGWIAIDYRSGNFEEREKNEDPFFIARGKRVEECGNGESKRRLEEVLDAYTAGPFFVARGKKQTYDEEIGGDYEGARYEASNYPSSKRFQEFRFGSNMDLRYPMAWHRRTRRGASSRNREEEEEEEKEKEKEEREYAGAEKFSRDHYSDKGRTLTMDKSSPRDFHTYDEINEEKEYPTKRISKKNDMDNNNNNNNNDNNSQYYDKSNVDAVSDIKLPLSSLVLHRLSTRGFLADYEPRNAQTQSDKHSNLQSILDEPFFISRGRKRDDASREPGYLREVRGDDLPIKKSAPSSPSAPSSSPEDKPVIISDIFNIYRGRKTSSLYYGDEVEKKSKKNKNGDDNYGDTNDYENNYEKSKNQHRQLDIGSNSFYKQLRNRRGMLDDLLSSDDPFYVARGKRLQLRRPVVTINKINTDREDQHSTTAAAAAADELSIYAKSLTRRTKLLRKLSDLKMPNNFYLYNITDDRTVKKIN